MRVFAMLALGASALLASASVQAHTQPTIPKDVQVLDHMVKAFAHHEVKPLPVKASALPGTSLVVPAMLRCQLFIEPALSNVPAVPSSVPLVAGPAISPATPPPSK